MRKESNWIYGIHAVSAALQRDSQSLLEIRIDQKRNDQRFRGLLDSVDGLDKKIRYVSKGDLDALVDGANHQGIAALCQGDPAIEEHDLIPLIERAGRQTFLLILDGVQDPHNLGACLRTADAAGVTAVIVPKDKAVGLTPTVRKVACGAAESVPFVQVTNLARTLKDIQQAGVWVVGLAGETDKTIYEYAFEGAIAVILGAEEKGLRRLTREHCDALVKIPMQGQVESLNVSVACGISLFEVLRQRGNAVKK